MKKSILLIFTVAACLQSCEEGVSPYKDADKVSGSIKEISFQREVPCEDGSGTCMDYTVCEENKVERTFTKDVEICVEMVESPVIAKSDYVNLQFSIELPDEVSSEFLYSVEEFFGSDCEISDEDAKINRAYFYYLDGESGSMSDYHYIECMSKPDGLLYEPNMVNESGDCVETGNNRAWVKTQVIYYYSDRKVNIRHGGTEVKLKKGWNRTVWNLRLKPSDSGWCGYLLSYSISTDNIPSDCEWVIIDDNENMR